MIITVYGTTGEYDAAVADATARRDSAIASIEAAFNAQQSRLLDPLATNVATELEKRLRRLGVSEEVLERARADALERRDRRLGDSTEARERERGDSVESNLRALADTDIRAHWGILMQEDPVTHLQAVIGFVRIGDQERSTNFTILSNHFQVMTPGLDPSIPFSVTVEGLEVANAVIFGILTASKIETDSVLLVNGLYPNNPFDASVECSFNSGFLWDSEYGVAGSPLNYHTVSGNDITVNSKMAFGGGADIVGGVNAVTTPARRTARAGDGTAANMTTVLFQFSGWVDSYATVWYRVIGSPDALPTTGRWHPVAALGLPLGSVGRGNLSFQWNWAPSVSGPEAGTYHQASGGLSTITREGAIQGALSSEGHGLRYHITNFTPNWDAATKANAQLAADTLLSNLNNNAFWAAGDHSGQSVEGEEDHITRTGEFTFNGQKFGYNTTINFDPASTYFTPWSATVLIFGPYTTTPPSVTQIDGYHVRVRESAVGGAYTFGTAPSSEEHFWVSKNHNWLILNDRDLGKYYTFGVSAYRNDDGDVVESSIVKTAVSGQDPYRPTDQTASPGDISQSITVSTVLSPIITVGQEVAPPSAEVTASIRRWEIPVQGQINQHAARLNGIAACVYRIKRNITNGIITPAQPPWDDTTRANAIELANRMLGTSVRYWNDVTYPLGAEGDDLVNGQSFHWITAYLEDDDQISFIDVDITISGPNNFTTTTDTGIPAPTVATIHYTTRGYRLVTGFSVASINIPPESFLQYGFNALGGEATRGGDPSGAGYSGLIYYGAARATIYNF